jgi:putative flippase GtrA
MRELAVFLAVGGAAAALYAGLGAAFTGWFGVRPSLSVILSVSIVLPLAYLAQRHVTFRSSRSHSTAFSRYVMTQAISNVVAIVGAELFEAEVRAYPFPAFLGIAVLVAVVNYFLLKIWVFGYEQERIG